MYETIYLKKYPKPVCPLNKGVVLDWDIANKSVENFEETLARLREAISNSERMISQYTIDVSRFQYTRLHPVVGLFDAEPPPIPYVVPSI